MECKPTIKANRDCARRPARHDTLLLKAAFVWGAGRDEESCLERERIMMHNER
jgi:hypothetical protein